MRLLSPDDACVAVTTRSGRKYEGTSFDVSNAADARDLRRGGYTAADTSGAPARADGYVCRLCGFHSFFRACSKCTGECVRPQLGT